MKTTRFFSTGFAVLLFGILSGCESGSSTGPSTSNPDPNNPSNSNSIIGTWSTSTPLGTTSRLTVATYSADSTYSETNTTTAVGTTSGTRISGTWSVSATSLTLKITKTETSSDGTHWTSTIVPSYTLSGDYVVAGGILSFNGSGTEVRYVQGNSGLVPPETILPPIISPAGGVFNASQVVTLQPANLGADIYFTVDGSTPESHYSLPTSGTVRVTSSLTIKAIAVKNGKTSEVASATFTIQKGGSGDGSINADLVGTWARSEAGYSETMTISSTGTLTVLFIDSTVTGPDRFTRITGTISSSGSSVAAVFNKTENSSNGSNWSNVAMDPISVTQQYSLSGTTLTLTESTGDRTVYTRKN